MVCRTMPEAARMDREGGFTLIELVMVILVIAILVAIAIPAYLSFQEKADKAVADYNIRAAEEIHNRIWFQVIENNNYPDDAGCYIDAGAPVDAAYISARETRIHWADVDASGSLFGSAGSAGMLASLEPTPSVLASAGTGFQFQINGFYRDGTLEGEGGGSGLGSLPGRIAVLYNTYYLNGGWYENTANQYLSMMVVERSGVLRILTFYQGRNVCCEALVWAAGDGGDEVNIPPGPADIGGFTVNPKALNLSSQGSFNCQFDVELETCPGFNANSIDMASVVCGGARAIDIKVNADGKVIIKFDRQDLIGVPPGDSVPVTLKGNYTNGDSFSGTANVKVIQN